MISITWFAGWRFALAVLLMVVVYYRPVSTRVGTLTRIALTSQAQSYRIASRQVRRLKAVLPGPVNAHFGETLSGAPVIRAFGAQGLHIRRESLSWTRG